MTNAVTHMAAMSAAMRMLLACDPLAKPVGLMIVAGNEVTQPLIEMMMTHAADRRTTFLLIFSVEDDTALLERVMVVDGSTTKNQINIGGGKFVEKADGTFAILSHDREAPYEYTFSRNGHRLRRQSVLDVSDRATTELRGLQALLVKAQTPACQVEALGASVSLC